MAALSSGVIPDAAASSHRDPGHPRGTSPAPAGSIAAHAEDVHLHHVFHAYVQPQPAVNAINAGSSGLSALTGPAAPTCPVDPRGAGQLDQAVNPHTADGTPRKPWVRGYTSRLIFGDTIAVAWAATGAHMVHLGTLTSRVSRDADSLPFIALTVCLAFGWMLALHWGGTRDTEVVGYGPEEYKRLVNTSVGLFGLIAICSYVFDLNLPRAYVLVMLPAGLVGVVASRFIWRRWLQVQRLNGRSMSNVLVVGNVRTVKELLLDLKRAPLAGYRVLGVCVQSTAAGSEPGTPGPVKFVDGVPVLGGLQDVASTALRFGADTVAVTSTAAFGPAAVRRLSWELEKTDIQLVLAPALTNIAGPRIHTKPVAGLPLIHVDRPTYRGANRILKKSFDFVGSVMLLLVFSPLLLGLAVAVKLSSPGPVFFRQQRAGINGKTFRMIKFRSMVVDAEARLADLRALQTDAGNEVLFKMKNDPRVTRIGRILRRLSLDELPQLINVLKGDMSLVGPRPPLFDEIATYHGEARLRLLVRPGMTGLWQISGRSTLSWEDSVRLDTYYVENWSLVSDLLILWKTAKAVWSSSGAY